MADLARIELVFARLLVRYGAAWRGKWAGVEPAAVLADWHSQLAGFPDSALLYALDNLPMDFPPTVGQFREVCLRAPAPRLPALPEPKADPARLAGELRRMRDLTKNRKPSAWMLDLEDRARRGERLSYAQRQFLDNAYANRVNVPQDNEEEITDEDRLRTEELKAEQAKLYAEYAAAWQ
jgi:hypothetical protein